MKKLLAGRVDVVIIGNGSSGLDRLIFSDPMLEANRDKFVVLPRPLVVDPLYLAFAKTMNMKPALQRFNKAITALRKSDEFQRVLRSSS
jgi:polar amino acid transport system substrate-binding protein